MRDSTHQPHEPRSQYPFPRHQQDVRRPGLQQRHQVYPNVHSPERPYALQHVSESPRSSQDPQHHPRPPPPPSYYSGGSGTQAYRPMKPHLMGRDHSEGEAALGGATGVSENFRNHSVPGVDHRKGSLPGQEPDKNHPGAGVHSEGPPSQSGNSTYSAGPSHQPPRTHGSIGDAPRGAMSPRVQQPLESPEDASSVNPTHRHPGDLSDGDERYAAKRGSIATDSAHSSNATHPGQSYGSPQRHHPHPPYHDFQRPDRLHSMGGNKAHKDSPQSTPSLPSGNKYNTLPPPTSHVGAAPIQAMPSPAIPPPISAAAGPAFTSATQHHQQQSSFSLTGHRLPGSPTSPRTTEELENRLHYVEDVCMSLKQHTQKLEQLQASQERTIQWMRERIEQMTDTALARRGMSFADGSLRTIHTNKKQPVLIMLRSVNIGIDSVTSPLTPQSGVMVMANKRKAESIPDDTRNRARYESFGIDGLDQHHHHIHGHGHGHSGPTGPVPGGPGFEGPTRGGYHEQGSAPSAEVQRYQQQQQHTHYQDQHRQHTMIPQMHHQHQQQHQQQQGNHGPQHRAHRPAPAAPGKLYL
ncbi:hypothetical protein BC939DRAFT_276673 [Gamsiella multidivaricata]|uniref:uncharacterized protein n=1 Tax=Gamsiella multidivaricata TaxID=101098 RepID=UPI002220D114|nr:uncharacterized protein BC939DRAFT_276673 [Gamsiella multidivaricata]KAI7818862.1 hypothetical protein BC939DRAFT_276673 [Gamsiella multidivaricata]